MHGTPLTCRVSRHIAVYLSQQYGLKDLLIVSLHTPTLADPQPLCAAVPDPRVDYRKSQRSQIAAAQSQVRTVSASTDVSDETRPKRARTAQSGDANTYTLSATTTVTGPARDAQARMEQEIAEAKKMVNDLRREMELRAAAGQSLDNEDMAEDVAESSTGATAATRGRKRGNEDVEDATHDTLGHAFGATRADRIVRANRRVEGGGFAQGAKKFALNALIFGMGVSAAACVDGRCLHWWDELTSRFLPQLAASFF